MKQTAVVILNWNGVDLLRHYLPVVLQATPTYLADVVVADNASTDDSVAVLKTDFPQVRLVELDQNYGFAGGYNRVVEQLVDYKYIVLLNSDVAPADGWLSPLLDIAEASDDVAAIAPKIRDDKEHHKFEYAGAAGGYLDFFGYPFCRGRIMDTIEADDGQYFDSPSVLWASGAALLVRRQIYISLGGLPESFFAHMEEIDLCWRMRQVGYRVISCGSSHVFHLGGATLSTTNPRKTYLNFRNNLWMIIRCHPWHSWWLILFCRMLLDGVAALRFLFSGQTSFFSAVWRAHIDTYKAFPRLIAERRQIQKKCSPTLPPEVVRTSIVWHYYVLRHKYFSQIVKTENSKS